MTRAVTIRIEGRPPTPERCALGCYDDDTGLSHPSHAGKCHLPSEKRGPTCLCITPAPAADAGRTHHVGDDCPGGHR